jgi:hypothetical protein
MEITKTYDWSRRDFSYDAKCEHCGNIDKHRRGYDDANYYNNVIPKIKCSKCGESTESKKCDHVILKNAPRYDANLVM